MLGELPERKRFLVGLPAELVVGHALEQFARNRHLVVELGKKRVDYGHGLPHEGEHEPGSEKREE